MCIICVDYQKQLLTAAEARRNMVEMVLEPGHREEIERLIEDRERVEAISKAPARYSFKVAVLSEPTEAELTLKSSDLKYETYRDSGPGGQHRNTSDTAVRVTHIPTGIQACSALKSQFQNKTLALSALRARLIEQEKESANDSRNGKRKSQAGTGQRSDKIRTIAFQRQRVECHKTGNRMTIKRYLQGYVDDLH